MALTPTSNWVPRILGLHRLEMLLDPRREIEATRCIELLELLELLALIAHLLACDPASRSSNDLLDI